MTIWSVPNQYQYSIMSDQEDYEFYEEDSDGSDGGVGSGGEEEEEDTIRNGKYSCALCLRRFCFILFFSRFGKHDIWRATWNARKAGH